MQKYEQAQETIALLKILALGNRQTESGKVEPADAVIRKIANSPARQGFFRVKEW